MKKEAAASGQTETPRNVHTPSVWLARFFSFSWPTTESQSAWPSPDEAAAAVLWRRLWPLVLLSLMGVGGRSARWSKGLARQMINWPTMVVTLSKGTQTTLSLSLQYTSRLNKSLVGASTKKRIRIFLSLTHSFGR